VRVDEVELKRQSYDFAAVVWLLIERKSSEDVMMPENRWSFFGWTRQDGYR
jgi:hypothetical protein